jgi:hypothetical protein
MVKFTALFMLVALRIYFGPAPASSTIPPFTSSLQSPAYSSAQLVNFTGSHCSNKVFLQWMVKENESADKFEVEKSADGKNFMMSALVFGTDNPFSDNYFFYEKASHKKFYYRIKIINKDRKTEYSPVIVIGPKA